MFPDQVFDNRLFRTFIEHSPVAMALFYGPDLIITLANQSVLDYWNRTRDAVLNKPLFEALPEAAGQGLEELLTGVYRTGERFVAKELPVDLLRNGQLERTYIDFVYDPFYETDPATGTDVIMGISVICTEITGAVTTRQKIEESEARFRSLIHESPVATCLFTGPDLVIDVANEQMIRFFGRGPAIVGKPVRDVLTGNTGDESAVALLMQVFNSGEPFMAMAAPAELTIDGVAGTYYFDLSLKPLRDAAGVVYGVLETATNVTGQVLYRQVIEENERRFRNLVEQAPVAIAIFRGPDHVIELANEAHLKIWGRRAEEVLNKPLFVALPEAAGQGYEELLANVLTTGEPFYANELHAPLMRHGQLETVYFNFVYQPLRVLDGTITGVIVVASEITEQVLARQKVEESEGRLRAVIEASPAAIGLLMGPEHVIENPNQAFIGILGKGPGIQGKPLAVAMPELITENQPFLRILDDVYATGKSFHAYGSPIDIVQHGVMNRGYYNVSYTPLFDAAGKVYAILDIAIDVTAEITGRKKLEESEERYRNLSAELEVLVQQRTEELEAANNELAATNEELKVSNEETIAANNELSESIDLLSRSNDNLEKFAYIASHDLQEPLRKVQQFGDLLINQYGSELGEGVDYLQRMQSAASRMSALIRDLLTYSRIATQQETIDTVPLTEVLSSVLADLDLRIQETGAMVTVAPLPIIHGDRLQLEQLFQNLLSNALKFRRAGVNPVIDIQNRIIVHNQLPASVKPTRPTALYHCIDVADNGIGFDEKYTDRIFQVFQRLHGKSEFSGTGIGLAICEKVAVNHGGAITASSQPGLGATFSVYLPV